MPNGYRLIVAALGGLTLLMAFGLGYYSAALDQPRNERYPSYRYIPDMSREVEFSGSTPPHGGTFEYREVCNGPASRNESDLCAQWTAARAGETSALWAARGFWIALIGSAFLMWQIVLTRKAVQETGEATQAMQDANEIARTIGQAQTKAYLSILSLEGQRSDEGLIFRMMVQNSGQSPALAAQVMLQIVDQDGSRIQVLPDEEHHIPAQSSVEMAYCYFNNKAATQWAAIVVLTQVAYCDVFGAFDNISNRFAGSPLQWSDTDFTDLTKGMHVASYLRSMRPEDTP